jgi:putative methionine-R-sulfoxide reductase with GAF domain
VSEDAAGVRIPITKGIAGSVAFTGQTVNVADAFQHPLFDPTMDQSTGYKTHSILCMPVKDSSGTVVAVIQVRWGVWKNASTVVKMGSCATLLMCAGHQ